MRFGTLAALLLSVATAASTAETDGRMQATGPFEIKLTPEQGDRSFGRMTMSKQYHGGLEATAAGEMLSGGDPKAGTAGYVAMETVTGSLDGKAGTFQLMQWGTMADGNRELKVGVVPGSGTGALAGISGTMTIEIAVGGKHTYRLEYAVAGKP